MKNYSFYIKEMESSPSFDNFSDCYDFANAWLNNTGYKIATIKYKAQSCITTIQVINRHYQAA